MCQTHQVAGVVKLYLLAVLGRARKTAVWKQRLALFSCMFSLWYVLSSRDPGRLVSASGRKAASLVETGKLP